MLAPGIRAAAAENKHLRDPGCSVPVARGPAERPETARPADLLEPRQGLLCPGVEKGLCETRDSTVRRKQMISS